jgi:hypothetical protein
MLNGPNPTCPGTFAADAPFQVTTSVRMTLICNSSLSLSNGSLRMSVLLESCMCPKVPMANYHAPVPMPDNTS